MAFVGTSRYFGATVDDVLQALQNTKADAENFVDEATVKGVMARYEGEIMAALPAHLQEIVMGRVRGHIVVNLAASGQTENDLNQFLPITADNVELYKNLERDIVPENAFTECLIDSSKYTIGADGTITFTSGLARCDYVVANYTSTFGPQVIGTGSPAEYTDGDFQLLKQILIDLTAYDLYVRDTSSEGNPLNDMWDSKKENADNDLESIRKGEKIPAEVGRLSLVKEVEVADEGKLIRRVGVVRV